MGRPRPKTQADVIPGFRVNLKVSGNRLPKPLKGPPGNLGGSHEVSATMRPEKALDVFRAVRFFMWGIALDEPIKPDIKRDIEEGLRLYQAEATNAPKDEE